MLGGLRRLAENLAKRVVWRTCVAENIAFRDESARERARARAQPVQVAAQSQPCSTAAKALAQATAALAHAAAGR